MITRRQFTKKAGLVTSISLSAAPVLFSSPAIRKDKVRVGIIGAENSHTRGFGNMFNRDKKFPGVELLYVWGETDEFAKDASVRGHIPNIVKDPLEMMGKIDALIVDHRHPKFHLAAALPFIKEGIPTFVDKPFSYRVAEAKEFLETARKVGTPVTSFSSIAHSKATFDMKEQISQVKDIEHVVMYGPAEIYSKYGGIFFYGVHTVQPMIYMFGEDVDKVRVTVVSEEKASANVVYKSGQLFTLVFAKGREWGTILLTKDGMKRIESTVEKSDPPKHYVDIVEMFRTGKEPRSHNSILKCVAVLQALEKSVHSGNWEKVIV
jgi:predicted dehydrogenase